MTISTNEPLQLGQQELRRTWDALRNSNLENIDNFRSQHFFVATPESELAGIQWDQILSHPFDSISPIFDLIRTIATPLGFALTMILFFHLWNWAMPISKDLSKVWRSSGIFKASLLLLLLFSIAMNSLMLGLLLLSAFTLTYSRRLKFGSLQFLAVALFWVMTPVSHIIIKSAEQVAAIEGLDQGRTRLEYSDVSMRELDHLERAYWSHWNGARDIARDWIARAPTDIARDLYIAIQIAQDGGPVRGLAEMQRLEKVYPANPYVLFNLAHLSVQTQNLVAADRARAQIDSKQLDTLNRKSLQMKSPLLWIPGRSASTVFGERVVKNIQDDFTSQPWKWAYFLGLPLLFGLFAYFRRGRASGLCDYTGEITPRVSTTESPLYLSSRVKGAKGVSMQRSQMDLIMRSYQRAQMRLVTRWSWVVPGLRYVILDNAPWKTLGMTGFIYLCLFLSIPSAQRSALQNLWPLSQNLVPCLTTMSWPILAIGGLFYILSQLNTYRRSTI